MRFNFSIAALACSLSTSALAAPLDVHYRITQIVPDTPASTVLAADLNNRGEVVGFVQDASGRDHAFAWRDGRLTNIGPLLDPTSPRTRAVANNDRGDILGFFFDAQSDTFVTVLLRRGEVTRIAGLPGAVDVALADINDRRQIAGFSVFDDGSTQAFLWEDGNVMRLPPLAGDATARVAMLNERGAVVGRSGSGPTEHVVIWEDAEPRDLNIPGALPSDINDREQVVGTLQRRGFLWERGAVTSLPAFEGAVITQAARINNAGEIVGRSDLQTGSRATLWEDEQIFNLNDLVRSNDPLRSFVTLENASSINDRGAIVATGRDSRFPAELRTYLLTPVH